MSMTVSNTDGVRMVVEIIASKCSCQNFMSESPYSCSPPTPPPSLLGFTLTDGLSHMYTRITWNVYTPSPTNSHLVDSSAYFCSKCTLHHVCWLLFITYYNILYTTITICIITILPIKCDKVYQIL